MKHLIATIVLTTFALICCGQNENLKLYYNCTTFYPNFTKVNVIDKRVSNQTLGFVQVGAFNRIAPVVFQGSLTDSLAIYFLDKDTIGKTPKELTILLYELYMSEKSDYTSETGRLKLSIRLFAKEDQENYFEILSIDSVYYAGALDVTNKLLNSVSKHMCEISTKANLMNLSAPQSNPRYTYSELQSIDSLEKLRIPIYNTEKFNSGLFTTYERFKANSPDSSVITIDLSDPKNIKVFKWDGKKKKRVDCNSVYAVSDGNTLLKATSIGFYKLQKINGDFYYVGQTSFSNSNNVAMWGYAFGLVGAAIASEAERNNGLFQFRINYIKGNSIPISKAAE